MANMTQDKLILIVISVIWACRQYCWQGTKHGKTMPPSRDVAKPVDYHENMGMAYMAGIVTANTVVRTQEDKWA